LDISLNISFFRDFGFLIGKSSWTLIFRFSEEQKKKKKEKKKRKERTVRLNYGEDHFKGRRDDFRVVLKALGVMVGCGSQLSGVEGAMRFRLGRKEI